jgi:hypothetical protein
LWPEAVRLETPAAIVGMITAYAAAVLRGWGKAFALGLPATVHVALGSDIVHQHPSADGAAIGQATFTDFQYSGLEIERDLTQTWNDVSFSRPSEGPEGNDQMFIDDESIQHFGVLSHHEEIPVLSDGETLGRAEYWVNRYGHPKDRPSPIVVKPRKHMATLFADCAGAELLDRIQIQRTPLGVGPTETYTGLIEQIEHRITNQNWETTFAISQIDVDEGAGFMVLNDSTLGQLDLAAAAY